MRSAGPCDRPRVAEEPPRRGAGDDRAAWLISALLGVAFLVAAGITSSTGLRIGYVVLAVASAGVAAVRFRAARR